MTSTSRRRVVAALAAIPMAAATAASALARSRSQSSSRSSSRSGSRSRPRWGAGGGTVHIAGDSTAAQKQADAAPETGWGMALPFFLREDLAVDNRAVNGRSSKSFVDEGRLASLLDATAPGDLVIVQFAHNDEKIEDPSRYTEPWTTYQDYLRLYLDGARGRGAVPVLATPVERRQFDDAGNAQPTHGEYPAAMRALATEQGVPLLDIQALSLALWQQLGVEETKRYFNWDGTTEDNTHFSPTGAIAVARLVAGELVERGVLSEADVQRLDEDVPPEWITWP